LTVLFYNGMVRDIEFNLRADRWGTYTVSIQFPFALLGIEDRNIGVVHPDTPTPFIQKGFQTVFEFYPEGERKPLPFLLSGVINEARFQLHTEVSFDYTFPHLFSFLNNRGGIAFGPYNAPSAISESRYYIDGSLRVLFPPQWIFSTEEFGGIMGARVDQGTVVLRFLTPDQQERVRWTLINFTPRTFSFNVNPNGEVLFTTNFIAQNFLHETNRP